MVRRTKAVIASSTRAARLVKNILSKTSPDRIFPDQVPAAQFVLSTPGTVKSPKPVAVRSIVEEILKVTPKIDSAKIVPSKELQSKTTGLELYREQRKKAKERQIIGASRGRAVVKQNKKIGLVASSNVESINYNESQKLLYIAFLNGSLYEYDLSVVQDPDNYALKILKGRAACITEGRSQYNGLWWWVGKKNPSYGAAVWKWLRKTAIPYRRIK